MSTTNLIGDFYPAYKAANPSFSGDTFSCAEATVEELIKKATTSEHPGMLLGKVQSGKTRTFISILALAFDNDFDIAIVLSKNSRALIEQTTKRLNTEFKMFVDDGELDIYDIMHAPESFGIFELDSKLIFVSKKQDDNLRRLIDLFKSNKIMSSRRTLIIDDEADNASIGYTKKAGIIEANKIASRISNLRSAIQNSSYLQVTATPYSLYLQPNEVEVANVITFKPTRPAFTKLVPVPAEYVGGETYFGESAKSEVDTLESLIHHTVDHPSERALKLVTYLMGAFSQVQITTKSAPFPPSDPDDEVFLLCALDGNADFLVSDDHSLFNLKARYGKPVIGKSTELAQALGV